MKKILVIEDDVTMREAIVQLLRKAGYDVTAFADFSEDQLATHLPDCVLLDLNLPNSNGTQAVQVIRQRSNVPIIMVTSSSSEADEALSIGLGADDYITKPYNPNILLLRIAAVLKRAQTTGLDTITLGNLSIDFKRGIITPKIPASNQAKRIVMTKNEMIILRHLTDNQGKIVTRDALMTDLWNNHEYINDNALTVNVSRLRTKLKSLGADNLIETRKGLGYILHEYY